MDKPKLLISRCLGFDACRYNGQSLPNDFVELMKDYADITTICPEVEIGLGVPRDPVRTAEVKGQRVLFQPASEKDFTNEIIKWNEDFFSSDIDFDGFILKNRSPSCGIGDVKVYTGLSKTAKAIKGNGMVGGYILEKFNNYPIEDEGRLTNFEIRDHFLIQLYSITKFKKVKKTKSINELIKFHTENKLLFMAYNQTKLKKLGQILANHEKKEKEEVYDLYENYFFEIFSKKPRPGSIINVLQHAFGGVSENLSKYEKRFFLNSIEEYRDERIPLSTITYLLQSFAIRFENDYLTGQSLLNPYPKDLLNTKDSGKKIRR